MQVFDTVGARKGSANRMKLHESHITDMSGYSLQGKPWFILCAISGDIVRRRVCLLGDSPRDGHQICKLLRAEILFIRGQGHADRRHKITPTPLRLTDGTRKLGSTPQTEHVPQHILERISEIVQAFKDGGEIPS
mgnify:CR=1 FL=1